MVEYARFAQIEALKQKGWVQDELALRLQHADETCGGPTYLRSPEGFYYEVSVGKEVILNPQPTFDRPC